MKKLLVGISSEKNIGLIEGQLKYFADQGYKTYLLAPDHPRVKEYCEKEGCVHLPARLEREIAPLKDIQAFFQILRHFRRIKPDIINLGTQKVSLLGMIAAWFVGVNYRIYTSRGFSPITYTGIKKYLLLSSYQIISKLSHKTICISKSIQENGINYGFYTAENSIVIHKGSSNGINLERFDPVKIRDDSKIKLKDTLGFNTSEFIFGYVGRLIDRKGINELYAAFDSLYKEDSKIRLLFVGPIEEIQIKDKSLVSKIKNHPGIVYYGSVPSAEVPLYLSIMNVMVLPAHWEGFGNVLIQAAAMGVPVISTKALGTVNAVNDGFNGILVEPKTVNELKEAMKKMLSDKILRDNYGKNGIEWAKNFERTIIWEGMHKVYNKIL